MNDQAQDPEKNHTYDQLAVDLQAGDVTDEALLGVEPVGNFLVERKLTSLVDP